MFVSMSLSTLLVLKFIFILLSILPSMLCVISLSTAKIVSDWHLMLTPSIRKFNLHIQHSDTKILRNGMLFTW